MQDFEQRGVSYFGWPSNPAKKKPGRPLYDLKDVVTYAV